MRKILVERIKGTPVSEHLVEIVERKGVGHPDYICDAIMEQVSVALSQEYRRMAGVVLHHNVDKGLLVAGRVERRLGGGRVLEPMRLIFGDRATFWVDGRRVPVEDIAVSQATQWLKKNLRFVEPSEHLIYQVELKPGAPELAAIFRERKGLLGANDTSAAVGYAPLTETERMVFDAERFLNSPSFKQDFPETGEDVKVMGFREGDVLILTVAMPLIDRFVDSEACYFKRKAEILRTLQEFTNGRKSTLKDILVHFNALDRPGRGMEGMYLSVLGTSAEDADSGEVGRGNRVNGIIALNRPASAEAAAGKNAVSHVGKIYNLLAHRIANEIHLGVPGIREAYVWLCSQIGSPIDQPIVASAQLVLQRGVRLPSVSRRVEDIIDRELAEIGTFVEDLSQGRYSVI